MSVTLVIQRSISSKTLLMASIRVLPFEILCHIFSYVVRGLGHKLSHGDFVRLGHVCSQWRAVILSTPKLWSQFILFIRDEIPDSKLQSLLFYVNNSGNSPFLLDVTFREPVSSTKTLQKLHEYVPKVHTLKIDGICQTPMEDFPQFPMSWLSSVENLVLWSGAGVFFLDPSINPRILLNGFTHLRKLELKLFGYTRDIQLPWEQITSLKLQYCAIDVCMFLLVRCPNLVEFHALYCIWPGKPYIHRPSSHAHKLEHLSWGFFELRVSSFLSKWLRYPSLRTFEWHSPDLILRREEDEPIALRSIVPTFPPSISQLRLSETQEWSDELMEFIFVELKGLKIIRFDECRTPLVIQFLSLLNRMSDWEGCYILPLLVEVVIEYPPREDDRARIEEELAPHMVPLFHLRDPHKTRQFSLHLVRYGCIVSEGLHEAYVSLKKDGYAFKISYYDSQRVKVPY